MTLSARVDPFGPQESIPARRMEVESYSVAPGLDPKPGSLLKGVSSASECASSAEIAATADYTAPCSDVTLQPHNAQHLLQKYYSNYVLLRLRNYLNSIQTQ